MKGFRVKGRAFFIGVLAFAPLLGAMGCEQLGRSGALCSAEWDCAVGLHCETGHCHHNDDPRARRPAPLAALQARAPNTAAAELGDPVLLAAIEAIGAPVTIEFITTRALPESAVLRSGERVALKAAAAQLERTLRDMDRHSGVLKVTTTPQISPADAARLGVMPLVLEDGATAMVGAVLRSGPRSVAIPALTDPNNVRRQVASGLHRLKTGANGSLKLGFICAADAWCPEPEAHIGAEANAQHPAWTGAAGGAATDTMAVFAEAQAAVLASFASAKIQPVAMRAGDAVDTVHALILASPSEPLNVETRKWLDTAQGEGVALIVLLPGGRYVASSSEFAAIKNQTALMTALDLTHDARLLVDRASFETFQAPGARADGTAATLPLIAQISRIHAGLGSWLPTERRLGLPLAGAFTQGPSSPWRAVAWSRPGAVSATLPADASVAGLLKAAPPAPSGTPQPMIVVQDGGNTPRRVAIASALGLPMMTGVRLLSFIDPTVKTPAMRARVEATAPAAERYRDAILANGPIRMQGIKTLRAAAIWAAEPEAIRALASTP